MKPSLVLAILTSAFALLGGSVVPAQGPRFVTADPVASEPELADASGVQPVTIDHAADAWQAIRHRPATASHRAANVNSIDEVPDSSWFTNRIRDGRLSADDIRRAGSANPAPHGPWTIVGGKTDGVTPGLRLEDAGGRLFFVKFDPRRNPELASGAEVIASRLLYALGYNVPENFVVTLRRDELVLAPGATLKEPDGRGRPMTAADVNHLLRDVARQRDGSYRVLASLRVPGTPIGPFRYSGVRADDPNDRVPHEDRRELRALRVFAAWLNHVDTKSQNTLDTLVPFGDKRIVRHYLIDFGSALGSAGVGPKDPWDGYEYVIEARPLLSALLTLGLRRPAWARIAYPNVPAVGRIDAEQFRVERWKPTFPNIAFDSADEDDLFWAGRRVTAFSDEALRAAVHDARFTDSRATDYIADALIARRDAIARSLLTRVNPLVDFAIADGRLSFANAAAAAGTVQEPIAYRMRWSAFDNLTGTLRALTTWRLSDASGPVVPGAAATADYLAVEIAAHHSAYPAWERPLTAYFRRDAAQWTLVGLTRAER